MSKSKKAPVKKKVLAKKSSRKPVITDYNGMDILKLENNIPLPARGVRDPLFLEKASKVLNDIKVSQSFVVPKPKLYAVQKLVKTSYQSMVIKSAVIKPDNKFARIWRVK